MRKIMILLFLFNISAHSQEIMNEEELIRFLNLNLNRIEISIDNKLMNTKYITRNLFSEEVNEKLTSFNLKDNITYRKIESIDRITLEFIFRNKESIKKTGFKLFSISFYKEEALNLTKAIATLKTYQNRKLH